MQRLHDASAKKYLLLYIVDSFERLVLIASPNDQNEYNIFLLDQMRKKATNDESCDYFFFIFTHDYSHSDEWLR